MQSKVEDQDGWDEEKEGAHVLVAFSGAGARPEGVDIAEEVDDGRGDEDPVAPEEAVIGPVSTVKLREVEEVGVPADGEEKVEGDEEEDPSPHPAQGDVSHDWLLQ